MSDQSGKPEGISDSKKVDESWKETVTKEKKNPSEKPASAADKETGLPEPNFAFFISSLGMQALMAMGELADPRTKEVAKVDLVQAQYIIEVIRMLADKTKNNLSPEESELLKNLLYELQVKFVQKTQAP